MFTLKLWKHRNQQLIHKTLSYHHVKTLLIGREEKTLEVWAFHEAEPSHYDCYYIGQIEDNMTAIDRDGEEYWEWGLLENQFGQTTEHYRPHSYGHLKAS